MFVINISTMKHIIFISIILSAGMAGCKTSHLPAGSVNSQPAAGNRDTARVSDSAAYVKNIMSEKSKYVHKELGALLKDLAIPVKSYTSQFSGRANCIGITLSFDEPDVTVNKSEGVPNSGTPARLYVEWESPISRAAVEAALNRAAGSWGNAEQAYYSKITIRDIR
jgi:hypothetical protein